MLRGSAGRAGSRPGRPDQGDVVSAGVAAGNHTMSRTASRGSPLSRMSQVSTPPSRAGLGGNDSEVPWHRQAVGGLWDEVGKLQFDFMTRQGLLPSHRLLDVGCGSMRGGVHFVGYLDPGNYYGVDASADLLAAGLEELRKAKLSQRSPHLRHTADFDLDFGCTFQFALAQSLFTHLPLNSIHRCLLAVEAQLDDGGTFFATCFVNPLGRRSLLPIRHSTVDGDLVTYLDRDPYHYDVDVFRWLCEGSTLDFRYVGPWGHPRDQHMLRFDKH
jgi:hypothetical protein